MTTDNFKPLQAQSFALSGGGAVAGATSIVLKSFTQIDGTTITMTNIGTKGYMTLEPGNGTLEEQISFTGVTQNSNGTATLTGVSTVLFADPYTESSGLAKTHAGSTTAILSNTSGFYNQFIAKNDDAVITGQYQFPPGGNINAPVSGTAYITPTNDLEYASKHYVDTVAVQGAPVASPTTLGIAKLSTAASVPANPIVVGTNDTRVPTQTEADALAGTSGTPSSSNKYVTNADTSATGSGSTIPRGTSGVLDISWIPTGTSANKVVELDGSAKLPAVDGSQLTNVGVFTSGDTSKDSADASTTQNIAHGLGKVPKFVEIIALGVGQSSIPVFAITFYNGSAQHSISYISIGSFSASNSFNLAATNGNNIQSGVVTWDATNIIITWTKSGSPTGVFNLLWRAQA